MGLKDKWAAAQERSRQEREVSRARIRCLDKADELRRFGVPVPAWGQYPLEAELSLDALLAAEKQRRVDVYQEFASVGTVTTFRAFGVQVLAGENKVYTIGEHNAVTKENGSRLLGPLAGTQAMVTDGSQAWSPGRAAFLPISLAGLATKTKADAAVVFPDGTVHTSPLDGNYAVREAQKQAVQFNALAGTAATPAEALSSDPATKLRKLQELLDAGLLSQEEYNAKRAQVIRSI